MPEELETGLYSQRNRFVIYFWTSSRIAAHSIETSAEMSWTINLTNSGQFWETG